MRIGERLVRDGLLTPEQLDQALRAQVIRGGRLGTVLVELGFVGIDALAEALGRAHGLPAALQRHFERSDRQLQTRLPAQLAAAWRAVPIGRTRAATADADTPELVVVAVMDPLPARGMRAVEAALGGPLALAVTAELRVLYWLESVYGIPRPTRFVRLPPGLDHAPAHADDDSDGDADEGSDGEADDGRSGDGDGDGDDDLDITEMPPEDGGGDLVSAPEPRALPPRSGRDAADVPEPTPAPEPRGLLDELGVDPMDPMFELGAAGHMFELGAPGPGVVAVEPIPGADGLSELALGAPGAWTLALDTTDDTTGEADSMGDGAAAHPPERRDSPRLTVSEELHGAGDASAPAGDAYDVYTASTAPLGPVPDAPPDAAAGFELDLDVLGDGDDAAAGFELDLDVLGDGDDARDEAHIELDDLDDAEPEFDVDEVDNPDLRLDLDDLGAPDLQLELNEPDSLLSAGAPPVAHTTWPRPSSPALAPPGRDGAEPRPSHAAPGLAASAPRAATVPGQRVATPPAGTSAPGAPDARAGAPGAERRRFVEPLSEGRVPRSTPQLGRIALVRVARSATDTSAIPREAPLDTTERVVSAIRRATGRDRVGDLVVGAMRDLFDDSFDAGVILIVRGAIAIGWKGFARGRDPTVIDALAVPLDRPSVVQNAFHEGRPVIGAVRQPTPLDRRLWAVLGEDLPRTVAVLPVMPDTEVACLVYAHSADPPDAVAPEALDALRKLARASSRAFARLIRAAQR